MERRRRWRRWQSAAVMGPAAASCCWYGPAPSHEGCSGAAPLLARCPAPSPLPDGSGKPVRFISWGRACAARSPTCPAKWRLVVRTSRALRSVSRLAVPAWWSQRCNWLNAQNASVAPTPQTSSCRGAMLSVGAALRALSASLSGLLNWLTNMTARCMDSHLTDEAGDTVYGTCRHGRRGGPDRLVSLFRPQT